MDIGKIIVSLFLIVLCLNVTTVQAKELFKVQQVSKNRVFIINDNQFTLRDDASCGKVVVGDVVRFVEGSPSGVCIAATFIDLRTGAMCDVWCH